MKPDHVGSCVPRERGTSRVLFPVKGFCPFCRKEYEGGRWMTPPIQGPLTPVLRLLWEGDSRWDTETLKTPGLTETTLSNDTLRSVLLDHVDGRDRWLSSQGLHPHRSLSSCGSRCGCRFCDTESLKRDPLRQVSCFEGREGSFNWNERCHVPLQGYFRELGHFQHYFPLTLLNHPNKFYLWLYIRPIKRFLIVPLSTDLFGRTPVLFRFYDWSP